METTSFEQIRLLQYLLYSYVIVYFWIRIPQDQPMISFRLYQKSNHARHLHHWSSLSSWWAEPNNFQSFQSLLIIIVIIFTNFQSFNGVVSEVPIKTLLLSSAPLITHRPMSTAPLWARWWWWWWWWWWLWWWSPHEHRPTVSALMVMIVVNKLIYLCTS